jgi:2,3-bisphosphoglycerate-dependent phosphoglycerate mutase
VVTPHVLLVRHAESVRPVPGGPDEYARPLTERGHAQAAALADELVAAGPVRFVSSPYARAVDTVAPAARRLGLEVERRHELREWDAALPPTDDWERLFRTAWRDPDSRHPGGESHRDLGARAAAALTALANEATPVVVGSHGTFACRALHAFGYDVDDDFWLALPMPAVFRLRWHDATVTAAGPGLRRESW